MSGDWVDDKIESRNVLCKCPSCQVCVSALLLRVSLTIKTDQTIEQKNTKNKKEIQEFPRRN